MHAILTTLSAVMLLAGPLEQGPTVRAAGDSVTVTNCLITLINEVDVPAEEAGVLEELAVVEGQQVAEGTLLGRIDDAQSIKLRDVAKFKLDAAQKEAGNDINVRYARSTRDVADAELQQAVDANLRAPNTVTRAEMRRLALEIRKSELGIEQAEHEQAIAGMTVGIRRAELDVEEESVLRRQLLAPIKGVVEKRYVEKGEWLKPGDPVVQIVRMDRLRIETFLDATNLTPSQVDKQPVAVKVRLPGPRDVVFEGQVVFVSQRVMIGPKFQIRAEVINVDEPAGSGQWLLRPGLNAEMTIVLKKR